MNSTALPRLTGSWGLLLAAFVFSCAVSCAGSGSKPPAGDAAGTGGSGGSNPGADRPADLSGEDDTGVVDVPGSGGMGGDGQGGTGGMAIDPRKINGLQCNTDSECRSGFCVDGVCCDDACGGTCLSCAVKGSVGHCIPAEIGTDPRDQCADQSLTTCGSDGVCDGSGACRKYPAGATCAPASCSGSTMNLISRCDGGGACVPTSAQSCAPYTCDPKGCKTSCKTNDDCLAPNTCDSKGSCGKKPLGSSCTDAAQCNSGFCEQGTCCGAKCDGLCKSCALPGTAGTCATVPAGQDPLGQCADSGAATCGTDGACNGAGACRTYLAGTICSPATCSMGTEAGTRRCDGSGVCAAGTTRNCEPFVCSASSGNCQTACASSADCATDYFCIGGTCTKKAQGTVCADGTECLSGFCQQGVCCNRQCTGGCRSCNLTGLTGTCTPVAAGQDPLNQCADTGPSGCGTDGVCDGDGACRLYANGTVCGPGACAGSTQTLARRCNGLGACLPGTTQDCAPFVCASTGTCLQMCSNSNDCTTGNVCVNTSCGKKPLGAACVNGPECASGTCAQGVCCGTACGGTCMSCAVPGSLGTCSAVHDGEDPLNQCNDAGAASCGNDGTCNGNGACRLYNSSTSCAAATCVGSTFTPGRSCDGKGTCPAAASDSCHNYACDTTTHMCKTTCAGDGDCVAPNICLAGVCRKKDLATQCDSDDECATGFCQQHVCCSSTCTGVCRSCALPTTAGTCTPIPPHGNSGGACPDDGPSSCKRNGLCDGAGNCEQYPSGTTCAPATCATDTVVAESTCNAGSCVPGSSTQCKPNTCDVANAKCRNTCNINSDCVAPSTCGVDHLCTGGKKPGDSCTGNTDCATMFCAQGVCCDNACTGTCQACNLTGTNGTCTNVKAGDPPAVAAQCANQGMASCGTDGTCNGSGGCHKYGSGTSCMNSVCDTTGTGPVFGRFTPARTCNATNMCATATSLACGNFSCSTTACKTSCTVDTDCAGTSKCFSGVCGGLKGEYFKNINWTAPAASIRIDANIDGSFNSSPFPLDPTWEPAFADNFTVRWTGWLTPRFTGTYVFSTLSDDGIGLFLNGSATPVPGIDLPTQVGGDLMHMSGNISLTKDVPVQIRVDYFENTGFAQFHLKWANLNETGSLNNFVPIPTARLTPAP